MSPERCTRGEDREAFLLELRRILPAEALLSDAEDLRPFECDALSAYTVLPWIAVLPATVGQVQAVLRLCHSHGVPVVARGAGTGLSGGALPVADGVLLSLAKFNRILEVDPANRMARVQPGVRNLAISEAAARFGLYYAPDPSSQVACTIGGNVAENSGGVHCLKYGLTVHNVLQVTLLTIEGDLLTLGSLGLDGPGYDLLAVVNGSEGLLGVIVEVVVKLLPLPETARTLLAAFDGIEAAGDAVAGVIGAGLLPAGLEMMDKLTLRATEEFVHAGYPVDAAAIVLCEMDGMAEQVEAEIARARQVLAAHGALEVRESRDEAERRKFWAGRKAAFPAVGRIAADYYCIDGTIPRKRLAQVLGRIGELSEQYGLAVGNVFHAGDGNLHPLILYDASLPGELERAEALGEDILTFCVEVGGTVTGEHGVGVEKLNPMCVQFSAPALRQFHALKEAFDDKGLLNPGKAVPTLARCAEFGHVHVHGGRLRHSELERF
ncbi:FAD-linked oxidase C-terminal domain-containing protein [Methylococcus geothermalis]|uniref:FAD-binding protein n=1 Tax=Methylococcus geothermalis TaxID=2681310 RepID=A0A858Q892_9GAMM|nr:FAD-linked oxidase C-terminal domain-containing protein [Methylococcus geothermalis]QJD30122.1 FAD-binding protein [Methylococcus geothermalis]